MQRDQRYQSQGWGRGCKGTSTKGGGEPYIDDRKWGWEGPTSLADFLQHEKLISKPSINRRPTHYVRVSVVCMLVYVYNLCMGVCVCVWLGRSRSYRVTEMQKKLAYYNYIVFCGAYYILSRLEAGPEHRCLSMNYLGEEISAFSGVLKSTL